MEIDKGGRKCSKAPAKHISRKDAMRKWKWKLTEQDLVELEGDTVIGTRRRERLFYPDQLIKLLADT